jgi:hypothetical protein
MRETIGELAMQSSHTYVDPLILHAASDEYRPTGKSMMTLSCLLAELVYYYRRAQMSEQSSNALYVAMATSIDWSVVR